MALAALAAVSAPVDASSTEPLAEVADLAPGAVRLPTFASLGESGPAQGADVCSRQWVAGLYGRARLGADDRAIPSVQLSMLADMTATGAQVGLSPRHADADPQSASLFDTSDGPSQTPGFIRPNDELFPDQRNLMLIQAPEAWSVSFGGDDVTIAVLSTGINRSHLDLKNKIWSNVDELPNGVDDDGNGYIDDTAGWDFYGDVWTKEALGIPDPDPSDWGHEHGGGWGTMLSGVAAAETNNRRGVAGVSWGARIMPLKVMFPFELEPGSGNFFVGGYPQNITEAICYAANEGARVILIAGMFDPEAEETVPHKLAMREAIEYAHRQGASVVAPAGERGNDGNPEVFPANLLHVIGVQGVTAPGPPASPALLPSASYGHWVDIVAPGVGFPIVAPPGKGCSSNPEDPCGEYWDPSIDRIGGPSMIAAAHVAGAIAMLRTVNPEASPLEVECNLCSTSDRRNGGPFDQTNPELPGCGLRNDTHGCGLLDLQEAVVNTEWVVRLTPEEPTVIAKYDGPIPCHKFSNRYLNAGAWDLRTNGGPRWAVPGDVEQPSGGSSFAEVCVDREILVEDRGIQAGDSVSATLSACSTRAERDCTDVTLHLRFFEELVRLFLPRLVSR